jgi:hypothetical protein
MSAVIGFKRGADQLRDADSDGGMTVSVTFSRK